MISNNNMVTSKKSVQNIAQLSILPVPFLSLECINTVSEVLY